MRQGHCCRCRYGGMWCKRHAIKFLSMLNMRKLEVRWCDMVATVWAGSGIVLRIRCRLGISNISPQFAFMIPHSHNDTFAFLFKQGNGLLYMVDELSMVGIWVVFLSFLHFILSLHSVLMLAMFNFILFFSFCGSSLLSFVMYVVY